jgi:hypothetical protein
LGFGRGAGFGRASANVGGGVELET